MKKMAKHLAMAMLSMAVLSMAQSLSPVRPGEPENPATGVWIQQVGDIVEQPSTNATLYYTKYIGNDRVKSIDYFYDGLGYLRLLNKKLVCNTGGADGIMHHPTDGYLIVAGQAKSLHLVRKDGGKNGSPCLARTSSTDYKVGNSGEIAGQGGSGKSGQYPNGTNSTGRGFWHVMVDPNGKYVWANGMPGPLVRYALDWGETSRGLANVGYEIQITPADHDPHPHIKEVTTVIWDEHNIPFYTYSTFAGGGCESDIDGNECSDELRAKYRGGSHFGYLYDTNKVVIQNE